MQAAARPSRAMAWGHRWGMVLVVLILLAWLWGLFFWFSAQQKRQLLVDRGAELALMASAVAQQSAGILHTVEGNLQALDVWLATHPGADPLSDPRFLAMVDQMRGASGGLLDIRMVSDAASSITCPPPMASRAPM